MCYCQLVKVDLLLSTLGQDTPFFRKQGITQNDFQHLNSEGVAKLKMALNDLFQRGRPVKKLCVLDVVSFGLAKSHRVEKV